MRYAITLLTLLLLIGCASGPSSDGGFVTRHGVIVGKEVIMVEESSSQTQVDSSVSVGVSSGRGLSIGLGFWLSPAFRSSQSPPVRYRIQLLDEEEMVVYHESHLFEVDDCVEISYLAGDDRNPPIMKRIEGGCVGN